MSELISELIHEHALLLSALDKAGNISLSIEDRKKEFDAIKELLLLHIQNEDKNLYPVLKEAAKTDPTKNRLLNSYFNSMSEISQMVFDFVEKYSKEKSDMAYIADFQVLYLKLKSRINKEENILFPKYESLFS